MKVHINLDKKNCIGEIPDLPFEIESNFVPAYIGCNGDRCCFLSPLPPGPWTLYYPSYNVATVCILPDNTHYSAGRPGLGIFGSYVRRTDIFILRPKLKYFEFIEVSM